MSDQDVRYFTCEEFEVLLSKVKECSEEIDRLRNIIKSASELAGARMLDEAAEILHNEVFPPIESKEPSK